MPSPGGDMVVARGFHFEQSLVYWKNLVNPQPDGAHPLRDFTPSPHLWEKPLPRSTTPLHPLPPLSPSPATPPIPLSPLPLPSPHSTLKPKKPSCCSTWEPPGEPGRTTTSCLRRGSAAGRLLFSSLVLKAFEGCRPIRWGGSVYPRPG